ncbi:MAG: hypothetical protein GFH27_549285n3 [Chloroflexi bacterium AL-W]|nr:hypothetical protein [Chloroflexi bacterium AL-N1]NOK65514.1 hypothetical protein [Chloroflexi bacterium AL-N10]NOK74544.1 hypothetical protein [Chloroflexi bacterium AL-N5]NOK80548.1 hypothetical protein [Chloroflexi bacterium AL-W]NOK88802.1 hypothetical protein [Chloroflexi bacterium AL-N15]
MKRRCLADVGGPFYDVHKPFRNWSALPFYQLDLSHAPYVDCAQLATGIHRAQRYIGDIHTQGYNGIVIDNMAHLITFDHTPVSIYPADNPYRQRAMIYRDAFSTLFETATQHDMDVFVTTDMQWSTPLVRQFVGRLDPDNPRLTDINIWALQELFITMPQVRGLMVRIGETGGAHDQGDSYQGHMLYTSTQRLRYLIDTLLPICEAFDRLLIIRTWSIGIGELGDLMWSPERYRATFARYTSPHLVISIKHGPSDFFRLQPRNPTLGIPGPTQIVELQNRREYELFGMVPSAVVPLHQDIIQQETSHNPRFGGVWAWNGSGGWGGGDAALGQHGWSVWTELSSAVTATLIQSPDTDTTLFVQRWCIERFDEPFGNAVANIYLTSAKLFEQSWYVRQHDAAETTLGAIYIPSLLWMWWMRPTASLIFWAYLASVADNINAIIHDSATINEQFSHMVENLLSLTPSYGEQEREIAESVRYLRDVMCVAHHIRALLLRAFDAVWQNERHHWTALAREAAGVQKILQQHYGTWQERGDYPPLELDEIRTFLRTFHRTPGLLWPQARATCLLISQLRTRRWSGRHARIVGMSAATMFVASLLTKGRRGIGVMGVAGVFASVMYAPPVRQHAVGVLLPWLNRRFYLLPSIFFETGPSITEWTM